MRDRMQKRVVATLKDGTAQYIPPTNAAPVNCIDVIIDHNLVQNGPEGLWRSDAIGISFRTEQLGSVQRGGVFVTPGKRYLVEDTISDDGTWIVAACMEQKP